ncbi:aa3-type cytochrome c oxidase subunit IV [Novosphingobium piscinae]|uniref:Aa3-type cytochrome c oxidase subunit IV n=1 Tax=Novosphingobium piscinae TaxID=1507448 RepID=A0A7X1KPQ8_9SPHN|nr:aa3-type cytochrome c oxidase subunit IV [Novosphingobium piscinae]
MASGNDIKAARETYEAFIGVVKWTTPALIALTAFVVYLLAR